MIRSVVAVRISVPEGLLGMKEDCVLVVHGHSWDPTAFHGHSGFGRAPLLMAPWSFL